MKIQQQQQRSNKGETLVAVLVLATLFTVVPIIIGAFVDGVDQRNPIPDVTTKI